MLAKSTIEAVKAYPDLVSVVSEYVTLKKRGRNYLGLCPFHSEKTPSFTVSPDKQIWHCFGCHESGNLISFIMKIENQGFTEACTTLAQKLNIPIEYTEKPEYQSKEDQEFEQIRDLLYQARVFFQEKLTENKPAQDYLKNRKLNEKSIRDFHLGYAPYNSQLLSYLRQKGFKDIVLGKSGLFFLTEENELRERFRNRVIFPIVDERGRTIAFGGRIFNNEENTAKYLNSEETVIFNKRKTFYALNLAKAAIQEKNFVILMEGYLDVIATHQAGFRNTIGTMGTALTLEHLQKLKRFTENVYLAFDNDKAGVIALERNSALLSEYGFKIKVIRYLTKDPAEYLNKYPVEEFEKLINQADSLIIYHYKRLKEQYGLASIENKLKIIEELIPLLKKEQQIVQDHYLQIISQELKIGQEVIKEKLRENLIVSKRSPINVYKNKDKYRKAEEIVLYLYATKIGESQFLDISEGDFSNPMAKKIFAQLQNNQFSNINKLIEILDKEEKAYFSQILILGGLKEKYSDSEITDYLFTLKNYQQKKRLEEIRTRINELESISVPNDEELNQLLNEYNCLIRVNKEG